MNEKRCLQKNVAAIKPLQLPSVVSPEELRCPQLAPVMGQWSSPFLRADPSKGLSHVTPSLQASPQEGVQAGVEGSEAESRCSGGGGRWTFYLEEALLVALASVAEQKSSGTCVQPPCGPASMRLKVVFTQHGLDQDRAFTLTVHIPDDDQLTLYKEGLFPPIPDVIPKIPKTLQLKGRVPRRFSFSLGRLDSHRDHGSFYQEFCCQLKFFVCV
ncbi:hypothetical protein J1605_011865 [Eschrichtius robustus]|uniref:Uncharacterized protein n=1 Tax=Eschrichtius robustus TaxID=9764 RepID=A0AB34GML8_ESCRO|nr:hypothetical protein J1605_011865 [Eschrichtius robustus]